MAKLTRSDARKRAYEIIFSCISDRDDTALQLAIFFQENPEYERQTGYITKAVCGALEEAENTEEIINSVITKGWTFKRLSKMCRSALLLSVYEMRFIDDVPPKVAVNEAVEIAKTYGDDNEPALINGVLGKVIKEYCNEQ